MLCESFQRLSAFNRLNDYEYIGFGAFYFADFKLLHRQLGLRNMISIEHDASIQRRVNFNKPYSFVRIKTDSSTEVLRNHNWRRPVIVWLDYDTVLQTSHMRDLEAVIRKARSGSVILLTTDADPKALDRRMPDAVRRRLDELFTLVMPELSRRDELGRRAEKLFKECGVGDVRLEALRKRLDENVPSDIKEDNLDAVGLPGVLARLVREEILRNLKARNATRSKTDRLQFQQLYNFTYADGRRMLTFGGILLDATHADAFPKSGIADFDFIRTGEETFEINAPELTLKEMKFLEEYVPKQRRKRPTQFEISPHEFDQYCTAYRYYPLYAEFDL
jgi:hypothetical protein